jgi:antitoxin YefM
MDAITYTKARKNFAKVMNSVCEDHAPIIITRQNSEPVVMMSLADYNSLEETMRIYKNPRNAMSLLQSIAQYETGKLIKGELVE